MKNEKQSKGNGLILFVLHYNYWSSPVIFLLLSLLVCFTIFNGKNLSSILSDTELKPEPKAIIFVNDNIAEYERLIQGIENAEIVVLDHQRDEISKITEILEQKNGLTSMHIISHGKPGGFALGNTYLTSHNIPAFHEDLASWKSAFIENADLLVYSCRVVSGKYGSKTISLLHDITGLDVAASNDPTGNNTAGGDWDLEYKLGNINTSLAVHPASKSAYRQVLTTGGPDTFGYTFIDSDEIGGTVAFEDISGTGTATGLGDDGEINVTMPFEFNLYGTTSTSVRIGENGAIRFAQTGGNVGATNRNLPRTGPGLFIAPWWDDLYPENGGEIYYETKGSIPNRRFIVQWEDEDHFILRNSGTNNYITFQLVLYEGSNNIDFVYQDTDFNNATYDDAASATIGIQDGTDNLRYSFNSASLSGITSIRYTHPDNAVNMAYTSSTATQSETSAVLTSTVDQQIIGIEVVMTGNQNPLNITSFNLSTSGATDAANDVSNAKLYYTGTGPNFATSTQFGTTSFGPNGSFTINGAQALVNGTNYFWLAYDIPGGATSGNVVDGEVTQITVNGSNNVPSNAAPAGNRVIASGNGLSCIAPQMINLSCGSVSLTGDTGLGTAGGEATCNGETFNAFEKFWYSFTGNGSTVTATTVNIGDPNLDDTKLWVYSGESASCGSLSCVTADDDGGAGFYSSVTFATTNGTNYYIVVGGFNGGDVGGFQLDISANCMAYSSSTTTQNTTDVETGSNNEQIIGLEVVTTGSSSPIDLSEIIFNTNGSTDPAQDFFNAKVYYTGTSNTFATGTQFGSTVASPLGKFEFTGTQTLSQGTNYFWLTYNIQGKATLADVVDAEAVQITVDGTDYTPSTTAPTGSRTIVSPATSGNGSNCSAATFLDNCSNSNVTGSTTGAINPGFSGCGANPNGGIIWYLIEGNGNTVTASTDNAGTDYDTYMWVFSGNCGGLTCVDSDDDGGSGLTSQITFTAAAHTTYYIAVGGYQANEGNFELSTNVGTPNCMSYTSSTTTQNTNPLSAGATEQQVIGVEVVMTNSFNPIDITSLSFNTTGTTATADISNAELYYTGTSNTFATNTQFGSTEANPNGAFTFNDTQQLIGGTNYFWLVYDIRPTATTGNNVDAQCTQITVDGNNYTPSITAPSGARTIENISPRRANALSFDGVDDYVNITGYKGILGNNARSLEAWVKTSSSTGPIISWGSTATGGKWTVGIENNGGLGQLRLDVEGGHMRGTSDLFDGEWHHLAVTYSGTNVTDALLYVDGELETTSSSSAQSINTASGNDVNIGGNSPDNNYFQGDIEEVRLWSEARSQANIRENMHLTLVGNETNLSGYWQFNESNGISVSDYLSSGNNGTRGDGTTSSTYPAWVESTVPLGAGTSSRHTISGTGNTVFGTTGISMNFTSWGGGSEEFVVYEITGEDAPGNNPLTDVPTLTDRFPSYWVVRQFGVSSFSTNITMVLGSGRISSTDEATPTNLKLIKRASNSFGAWSDDYSGASANSSIGEVVFNNVTSFSQLNVGTTGNSTLPVELLSFTATEEEGKVILNWATATELNNDFFEIQRSETGEDWGVIGNVDGNGTINETINYNFTDDRPFYGTSYYRLRQVDFDGQFEYSPVQSATIELHGQRMEVSIYPNPTNQHNINIRMVSPNKRNRVKLRLTDLSGKLYLDETIDAEKFVQDQKIILDHNITSGIYILEVKQDQTTSKHKIIIL